MFYQRSKDYLSLLVRVRDKLSEKSNKHRGRIESYEIDDEGVVPTLLSRGRKVARASLFESNRGGIMIDWAMFRVMH